jgi:hypothetical protein
MRAQSKAKQLTVNATNKHVLTTKTNKQISARRNKRLTNRGKLHKYSSCDLLLLRYESYESTDEEQNKEGGVYALK